MSEGNDVKVGDAFFLDNGITVFLATPAKAVLRIDDHVVYFDFLLLHNSLLRYATNAAAL